MVQPDSMFLQGQMDLLVSKKTKQKPTTPPPLRCCKSIKKRHPECESQAFSHRVDLFLQRARAVDACVVYNYQQASFASWSYRI